MRIKALLIVLKKRQDVFGNVQRNEAIYWIISSNSCMIEDRVNRKEGKRDGIVNI